MSVLFACMSRYYMCADTHRGQKGASDPLDLELPTGTALWVLGIEPGSSGRTANALNC